MDSKAYICPVCGDWFEDAEIRHCPQCHRHDTGEVCQNCGEPLNASTQVVETTLTVDEIIALLESGRINTAARSEKAKLIERIRAYLSR